MRRRIAASGRGPPGIELEPLSGREPGAIVSFWSSSILVTPAIFMNARTTSMVLVFSFTSLGVPLSMIAL
jgi:hypothetical protein